MRRLRDAGAVILGKTNLSEWANFRSTRSTSGWSSRGGQTKNPYVLDRNPCGSSLGTGAALWAYLSPDRRTLYTDFEVVPTNTIAARELPANAKPGPSPVVLRQWGGETQIDGVLVKISEEGFPLLPVDEPLLLILKFTADAGKYEVAGLKI